MYINAILYSLLITVAGVANTVLGPKSDALMCTKGIGAIMSVLYFKDS